MKKTSMRSRTKSADATSPFEIFAITTEALGPHEIKDARQELSNEDSDLLDGLLQILKMHPETINSEECGYFQELKKMRSKYPRNPVILNYLGMGYEQLKQPDKARDLIFETYEKFPEYLFGRTAKAKILFKEGKPEDAFKAIGNSLTIKQLYPHRDVFHASEVKVFEDVLVTYFYFLGDLEQAEYHFKIIKKIALEMLDNPQDPVFLSAQSLLQFSKEFLGLRRRKKRRA
jgi:tetratricopeptide (TPR) repeat protein